MKLANLRLANFTPAYSHFVLNGHTRPSLQLRAAFGFRREESIKIKPGCVDGGNILRLQDSWTKGGKYREVPIATMQQRAVLEAAKALTGNSCLIPAQLRYRDDMIKFAPLWDALYRSMEDVWSVTLTYDPDLAVQKFLGAVQPALRLFDRASVWHN
ncbi:integrase domain-containing protein [Janthinobacterium sp. TND4EL3]|uniref:integrase domain-containing protein n=1 Tax=Janthinobacterium sp. TND4EL3 TaxID=1907311 RepID=UPI001FCD51DB|nr:integrase domain-containing protein [Janthinobacterium sp. TND4EL3]